MSEDEVRITLRLPASLRDKLLASAEGRSRSMNGEIVERLDWSFDRAKREKADLLALVHELEQTNRTLQVSVDARAAQVARQQQELDELHESKFSAAAAIIDAQERRDQIRELLDKVDSLQLELAHQRGGREALEEKLTQASANPGKADDEPVFNIVLDAKGHPISWPEIAAHVHRTAKAAGVDTVSFRVAVFNADRQSRDDRDREYARLVRWYQDQTRKHKDQIREG